MMFPSIRELSHRFPLILASGSPRRHQFMEEIGCHFMVQTHEIEETRRRDESPLPFALRMAEDKALAIDDKTSSIILGCDTIVVVGPIVLGKPRSRDEAFSMLSMLSGQHHEVCTALAFVREGRVLCSDYDVTTVFFNRVSSDQIWEYIANGEPMDKAGAYGIQGMGGFLVDRIEGNLDTVVGLPRYLLDHMAAEILRNL